MQGPILQPRMPASRLEGPNKDGVLEGPGVQSCQIGQPISLRTGWVFGMRRGTKRVACPARSRRGLMSSLRLTYCSKSICKALSAPRLCRARRQDTGNTQLFESMNCGVPFVLLVLMLSELVEVSLSQCWGGAAFRLADVKKQAHKSHRSMAEVARCEEVSPNMLTQGQWQCLKYS